MKWKKGILIAIVYLDSKLNKVWYWIYLCLSLKIKLAFVYLENFKKIDTIKNKSIDYFAD